MHVYPKLLLKKFKTIQKKFLHPTNIKKICVLNIRMENLWIDELKLTAEHRNISDYENKSKEDLIKAFTKPKPKLGIKKNKIKEIRKDFDELRYKVDKKEIDKYRKLFYDIKILWYLSKSEIEETRRNFNELQKV